MSCPHETRRHALVDRLDVEAAGFPVGGAAGRGRQVVLHRRSDGYWMVVDRRELEGLSEAMQHEAIALAAAVAGGIDVVGRVVTEIAVEDGPRWIGVWRAHHRRRARPCAEGRRRGGTTC